MLAITGGLALLRYVWVWVSLHVTLFRTDPQGARAAAPNQRLVAAFSVAGVRGAVTLAGVLTLPLAMPNGAPFPARDLAIALAAGVILLSLVAASVGLPLLLTGIVMPAEPPQQAAEDRARVAAAEAAIVAVERALHTIPAGRADADAYVAAASQIIDLYRTRIAQRSQDGPDAATARQALALERELRIVALEAEREEVFRRIRAREVGSETGRALVRELDLLDTRYRI